MTEERPATTWSLGKKMESLSTFALHRHEGDPINPLNVNRGCPHLDKFIPLESFSLSLCVGI